MTKATAAVTFYASKTPGDLQDVIYRMAGRISMEGCPGGRLHMARSVREAVALNAGPADSDHDGHREWRRMLPMAERLVGLAEQASAACA